MLLVLKTILDKRKVNTTPRCCYGLINNIIIINFDEAKTRKIVN